MQRTEQQRPTAPLFYLVVASLSSWVRLDREKNSSRAKTSLTQATIGIAPNCEFIVEVFQRQDEKNTKTFR